MSTETAPEPAGEPVPGPAPSQSSAAAHRFVTSDGTALYVRDTDPGPPGALTVVFLHGWTVDNTSWDRVAAALPKAVDEPIRLLRYDHRGHGRSAPAPRGTATIAQLADDLVELLADRVPRGPLMLVGHSMGGMAIMALAERHPEVLKRVVAIGLVATSAGDLARPDFGLPPWAAAAVLSGEKVLNALLERKPGTMMLHWTPVGLAVLGWLLFGANRRWSDIMATVAQVSRVDPPSGVGFRRSLAEHDRISALAAFRDIPTVLMAGDTDRLTPPEHARRIAQELPDAKFVLFPGSGHMLPYERDAEVTVHLAQLLQEVRGQ